MLWVTSTCGNKITNYENCWECEATTDDAMVVTVRTASKIVGEVALCPSCCATCYMPLARQLADPEEPVQTLLTVARRPG